MAGVLELLASELDAAQHADEAGREAALAALQRKIAVLRQEIARSPEPKDPG
jgi:hypothetical protein